MANTKRLSRKFLAIQQYKSVSITEILKSQLQISCVTSLRKLLGPQYSRLSYKAIDCIYNTR